MTKVDVDVDVDMSLQKYPLSESRLVTTFRPITKVLSNHFRIDMNSLVPEIYQYHVGIYREDRGSFDYTKDESVKGDYRINNDIMMHFLRAHPDWEGIGLTYDDRSTIFTSSKLSLPSSQGEDGEQVQSLTELVEVPSVITTHVARYQVKITASVTLNTRDVSRTDTVEAVLRALNSVVLGFARHGQYTNPQRWYLVGSNAYRAQEEQVIRGTPYYIKRGYYAGLKVCMAGLVLVSDMTVSCFLTGGSAIDVVINAGGFRDVRDLEDECRGRGLRRQVIEAINKALKKKKMRSLHLSRFVKFCELGPAANSPDSEFEYDGQRMTVAAYFELIAQTNPGYREKMGRDGRLRYPHLPTVNIRSKKKVTLVPLELLEVAPGQSVRLSDYTEDMTAQVIKRAAALPADRFQHIIEGDGDHSVEKVLAADITAHKFGLTGIDQRPMEVDAFLLPAPTLKYDHDEVEPRHDGRWFTKGKFSKPATQVLYGMVALFPPNSQNKDRSMDFKVRSGSRMKYLVCVPNV